MERVIGWLTVSELRMFRLANRRFVNERVNRWLGRWLGTITHMGGATFTLASSLLCALLTQGAWQTAGWQSASAVAVSHLPVAIVKRRLKRLRPYQSLPLVHTCRTPLCDSSFPSGHTTAIFAWLLPWLLADLSLLPLLLPLALAIGVSVAWSRMYLGLHYPSDVVCGAALGSFASALVISSWPFS